MQPPEVTRLYFERYHAINPYFQRDLPQMETGRIFKSHETCSPKEFERTEFYQGFFRPLDLFHTMSAVVLKEGDQLSNLSLARSRAMGVYTNWEARLLHQLVPHLQRALRIGRAVEGLRMEDAAAAHPKRRAESWEAMAQRRYAFTNAEARLAAILVQGKSVAEAAVALSVSLNTVRTHLKHIFEKTGARRQSELVQLLLSGAERKK
jgi:DNA-binding CsgD family transcriptional regulator